MNNSNIKVISLNIEGDNHFDTVMPFLKNEDPDVVCLQEVLEKDVEYLKQQLNMQGEYARSMYIKDENTARLTHNTYWGVLLLTKLPDAKMSSKYYIGDKDSIPTFDGDASSNNRAIVIGEFMKDTSAYKVITTHFTWSPEGQSTPLQFEHLEKLFAVLENESNFILCGDFNAPRGRMTWEKIAAKYHDNIPPEVKTTMDPELHRVKNLQYVVDGLFTTNEYKAADVKVVQGVSDHQAIVGVISKIGL